jgi:hypothetical protein
LGYSHCSFFLLVFRKTLIHAKTDHHTVILKIGYPFLYAVEHTVPVAELVAVYQETQMQRGAKRRTFTIHHQGKRLIKMVPDAQGWSAEMLKELSAGLN